MLERRTTSSFVPSRFFSSTLRYVPPFLPIVSSYRSDDRYDGRGSRRRTHAARSKRPSTTESITLSRRHKAPPRRRDEAYVEFVPCQEAAKLISAYFGNIKSDSFQPDWEAILGANYRFFEGFTQTEQFPYLVYSLCLSKEGKKRYKTGRREAIGWIGGRISLP